MFNIDMVVTFIQHIENEGIITITRCNSRDVKKQTVIMVCPFNEKQRDMMTKESMKVDCT